MDPFTHIVLGAAVGYGLFFRELGPRAALIGALAAALPDADTFIRSDHDPLLYAQYHRQFTHSVAFSLVGALVVTLFWVARAKFRPHGKSIWACAWVGWLSHIFLDAATTYGTQLLWPVADTRFAWNLIAIVDPIFTVVLLLGLLLALFAAKQRYALAGLGLAALYLGLGWQMHGRALAAQSRLAQSRGQVIERGTAMPALANNLVWRSLYEHKGRLYSDRLRITWLNEATFCAGTSLPKATLASLTPFEAGRNRDVRAYERFAWFSGDWVARAAADKAVLGDMRYSLSTDAFDPIWGIRFTQPGTPVNFEWISRARERKLEPGKLWEEIAGRNTCYRPLP